MKVRISDPSKTRLLIATALLLAYNECGGTTGLGMLQARSNVTVENIVNDCRASDCNYPVEDRGMKEIYGDYIYGRMCKVGYKFDEATGVIAISDNPPRADYQGWTNKTYPTYRSLIDAAARQLGVTVENYVAPVPAPETATA